MFLLLQGETGGAEVLFDPNRGSNGKLMDTKSLKVAINRKMPFGKYADRKSVV